MMVSEKGDWSEEWLYKVAKGKVRSYVVRERELLDAVSKTLKTFLDKRYIFPKEVERILAEVEEESVETPFFREQPDYFVKRQRLDQLKGRLLANQEGKQSGRKRVL